MYLLVKKKENEDIINSCQVILFIHYTYLFIHYLQLLEKKYFANLA